MVHIYDESQFPHSIGKMDFYILCKTLRLPMDFINKASLIVIVDHDNVHLLKTRYLSGNSIYKLRHLPLIAELHMLHTSMERKNEILEDFGLLQLRSFDAFPKYISDVTSGI